MLSIRYQTRTTLFFQRLAARKNRAKRDAIYSTSSYIATAVKQTLRVRAGRSGPGAVPHAHTRAGLRVVRFAVDGNRSIIGPIRFPRSRRYNQPVPYIHEFGATVVSLRRFRVYHFPARPYMSRTLKRIGGRIPRQFSARVASII